MKLIKVKCKDAGIKATEQMIKKEVERLMSDYDWDVPLSVDWKKLTKKVVSKVVKKWKDEVFEDKQEFEDTIYDEVSQIVEG